MNKILILGSEGFIGKHLINYFISKNWEVFGSDLQKVDKKNCNYHFISGETFLENLFSEGTYDVCVNAAGSGSIPYSISDPVGDFEANSYGTIRILEGIRNFNPTCRYLHISSAAVYGNPDSLPVTESDSLNPLSPYGWHKLIAEQICREYHSLYDVQIVIARPFSVYGPGLKKQLFWDLYQKSLTSQNEIELWGSGNESRDFVYIDDLTRCIDLLINKAEQSFSIYNIGSGEETTIKGISEKFFGMICPDKNVYFNNKIRVGDPINWKADISRLRKLDYQPHYTIDQGVTLLVQWLKSLN